jgi:hypothetical protein
VSGKLDAPELLTADLRAFGVTPNTRYLYESRTHAEARSSHIAGIECGVGFQALIAPPGMGKTTILLSVLELKDVARTAFLFQIHGESRDFPLLLLLAVADSAPSTSYLAQVLSTSLSK